MSDRIKVLSRLSSRIANYSNNVNRYYFYLWLLGDSKLLARLPVSVMTSHIPTETGAGTWEKVKFLSGLLRMNSKE